MSINNPDMSSEPSAELSLLWNQSLYTENTVETRTIKNNNLGDLPVLGIVKIL